ncbi:MAG: hypothetical protein SF123_20375 [Chloroflexota bacterium]|nr:hypothetical protein [Chloroflexota bacterium]
MGRKQRKLRDGAVVRGASQVVIERQDEKSTTEPQVRFPSRSQSQRRVRLKKAPAETVVPDRNPTLVEQALALSRGWRMFMVVVFALSFVLLITPVVDNLYVTYMFNLETRILPSIVSVVFGIAIYALGWRLLIGYIDETPKPYAITLWYILGGLACVGLALILMLIGLYSNVRMITI